MKFCKYCGAKLKPDSKFCTNCGRRVDGNDQPDEKNNDSQLNQPVSKKNNKRKTIGIVSAIVLVIVVCCFGWWKYQHPSLQKAVTGSIYRARLSSDGEKLTAYLAFSKDGQYYVFHHQKDASTFENNDFDKAVKIINNKYSFRLAKYSYSINNSQNIIEMPESSSAYSDRLIARHFNRQSLSGTVEEGTTNPDASHIEMTKIGNVK